MTISETVKAIRKAKFVLIEGRFGVVQQEVKINKIEALNFLSPYNDNDTPKDFEMPCGRFGFVDDDGIVHLG